MANSAVTWPLDGQLANLCGQLANLCLPPTRSSGHALAIAAASLHDDSRTHSPLTHLDHPAHRDCLIWIHQPGVPPHSNRFALGLSEFAHDNRERTPGATHSRAATQAHSVLSDTSGRMPSSVDGRRASQEVVVAENSESGLSYRTRDGSERTVAFDQARTHDLAAAAAWRRLRWPRPAALRRYVLVGHDQRACRLREPAGTGSAAAG
jgi:hypothetical protein